MRAISVSPRGPSTNEPRVAPMRQPEARRRRFRQACFNLASGSDRFAQWPLRSLAAALLVEQVVHADGHLLDVRIVQRERAADEAADLLAIDAEILVLELRRPVLGEGP